MGATGIPTITVEVISPRDPSLFAKEHNKFSSQANEFAAEYHWLHHIPRHFQSFAKAKYGYFPRSEKYRRRKLKMVGARPDNVFSGKTEREVTTKRPQIRKTPKGSTLIIKLPISGGAGSVQDAAAAKRLFKLGRRKSATINASSQINVLRRVAEMRVVTEDEIRTPA